MVDDVDDVIYKCRFGEMKVRLVLVDEFLPVY